MASIRSAAGPSGVAEPATGWTGAPQKDSAPSPTDGDPGQAPPARPAAQINAEAEAARRAFHKAAGATATSGQTAAAPGRAAAMQAFFVANHGRGLLPAGETSGAVSPSLRSEES